MPMLEATSNALLRSSMHNMLVTPMMLSFT
jgi:hypothetical protein